jgi:hypothetical protein
MDVKRRKAAKIFACFLSGRKRAENMNRATALVIGKTRFRVVCIESNEPENYSEALDSPDKDKWLKAY